jgi:Tfp pilus assembly protein PilX
MNSNRTLTLSFRRGRRGVALLLVLSTLLLVSILSIAFLASVGTEVASSSSYARSAEARLLADSAVNLAIGQVQLATSDDTTSRTWISQPGLIRVVDANGQSEAFKLYSSPDMVETGFLANTASGVPTDVPAWSPSDSSTWPWVSQPALFTDLNSPVVLNNTAYYPIASPAALAAARQVEGFDVDANYLIGNPGDLVNGTTLTSSNVPRLPMPVQWLYILKDGTLSSATASGSGVTLNSPAVSAANPPVGRIAFWTDDETAKVNINTAAENLSWDYSWAGQGSDGAYAQKAPAPGEFQRFPGHPSTTSLSPIFGYKVANPASATGKSDLRNFIYGIAPRISGRGSQARVYNSGTRATVNIDNDRLYASLDEMLFLPQLATGERAKMTTQNLITYKRPELDRFIPGGVQGDYGNGTSSYSFAENFGLLPDDLEHLKFFLTAHSRAPEINLFNQPRLSLWPVDTRPSHISPTDKFLAFASSLGGRPYYFQRQNPNSATEDYSGIPNNPRLVEYLRTAMARPIPGFGGSFTSKYSGSGVDQLIALMFDYIRTVNLAYPKADAQSYAWTTNSGASGGPASAPDTPPATPGSGQVIPIQINGKRGFGRMSTLSKAAIAIIKEGEVDDMPAPGQTTLTLRAVLLLETFNPMHGFAGYVPDYKLRAQALANAFTLRVAGVQRSVDFKDGTIRVTAPSNIETHLGRGWGGGQGHFNHFFYFDPSGKLKPRTLGSGDQATGYPFVSSSMSFVYPTAVRTGPIHGNVPAVDVMVAGTPTVEITAGSGDAHSQTFSLPFASVLGLPKPVMGDSPPAGLNDRKLAATLQGRLDQIAAMSDDWREDNFLPNKVIAGVASVATPPSAAASDIIRGVEMPMPYADLRLAALQTGAIPLTAHPNYADGANPRAHSLARPSSSNLGLGGSRGTIVAGDNANIDGAYRPEIPAGVSSVAGDWSAGLASMGDGPYVIKADEGEANNGVQNTSVNCIQFPYFNSRFTGASNANQAKIFSASRQIASPVLLGTLPSGAHNNTPWQTLLFRPDFNKGAAGQHFGSTSPADHLLLDLFWMPVAEPYPMSENMATAGKLNLNTQVVPFTYIKRDTGWHGLLKGVTLQAVPANAGDNRYKHGQAQNSNYNYRYEIDAGQTAKFLQERFDANGYFISASEICDIPLVPKHNTRSRINTGHPTDLPTSPTVASINLADASLSPSALRNALRQFWNANLRTGDNAKESPYNAIYPRVTTRSNTFTVYARAQALRKAKGSPSNEFNDARDRVEGEYRGSATFERYLPAGNTTLPDFITADRTVNPHYRYRIIQSEPFAP